MFESDTPKHEYYHFYSDMIYTEKNNGVLPDDSQWGRHVPNENIPIEQAWFEGIATAFVLLEKESHLYQPVSNIFDFNYEEGFGIEQGDRTRVDWADGPDSEGAVTQFVYDLIDDTPNEVGDNANQVDNINLSASQINNVFDDRLSGETIVASTVLDFISDWNDESGYPNIDNVALLNTIIYEVVAPTPDTPFKGSLIFEDDFNTNLSKWILSGDTDWEIGQYSFDQPPFADNIIYDVATIDNCDNYCIAKRQSS